MINAPRLVSRKNYVTDLIWKCSYLEVLARLVIHSMKLMSLTFSQKDGIWPALVLYSPFRKSCPEDISCRSGPARRRRMRTSWMRTSWRVYMRSWTSLINTASTSSSTITVIWPVKCFPSKLCSMNSEYLFLRIIGLWERGTWLVSEESPGSNRVRSCKLVECDARKFLYVHKQGCINQH